MQDKYRVEQQNEEVPSEAEVQTHKDLLNQVKTTLLPDTRSLLLLLQEALDLFPETTAPKPKLNDALDVVSRFHTALTNLSIAVCTISPTIFALGRKSSRIDQTYGVLKRFRTYILEMDVTEITAEFLGNLFYELSEFVSSGQYAQGGSESSDEEEHATLILNRRTQLIATIDKILRQIDNTLELIDRSDFDILRFIWNEYDHELGDYLSKIAQKIHDAKDIEVPPAADQHLINIRPRILQLLQQIIPFVKLCRIFFKKISSAPPAFTFGEEMCSADLEIIRLDAGMINNSLIYALDKLLDAYDNPREHRAGSTLSFFDRVKKAMNRTLELISSHMVPADPARTVDDVMKEVFGTLKPQFDATHQSLWAALTQFEEENERLVNQAGNHQ
jgi:hypothetical protein